MGGSMTDGNPLRRIGLGDALCSFGLALNLTWCSLEGHSMGFFEALSGMVVSVNPRVFWLVGIGLVALLLLCLPQFIQHNDRFIRIAVPFCAAAGTACFAVSYSQSIVDPMLLATLGLILSGFGHFWFSAHFFLLLARRRPFTVIVTVVVGALLAKTVFLSASSMLFPSGWQVALGIAIPLVNALVFEGARIAMGKSVLYESGGSKNPNEDSRVRKHTVFGLPVLPRRIVLMRGGQRNLILLIFMSGIMLATVRGLSFWGLWGGDSSFPIKVVWGLSEFLTVAVCLIAFAYAALVKTANLSLSIRFQPATIVVVAGLFLVAMQQPGDIPFFGDMQAVVIHVDEACAYLLFWSVMALALDALDMPSFRVLGIGGMTFAVVSLGWVSISGYVGDIDSAFIVLVAYFIIVVAMLYTYRESKGYSKLKEAEALQTAQVSVRRSEDDEVNVSDDVTGSLVESINERCALLAVDYSLTRREAEVFCLLAQGRTRAFIQEELVLSTGTVKTHISHIYAKLDVSDRQGLMDLVLTEAE